MPARRNSATYAELINNSARPTSSTGLVGRPDNRSPGRPNPTRYRQISKGRPRNRSTYPVANARTGNHTGPRRGQTEPEDQDQHLADHEHPDVEPQPLHQRRQAVPTDAQVEKRVAYPRPARRRCHREQQYRSEHHRRQDRDQRRPAGPGLPVGNPVNRLRGHERTGALPAPASHTFCSLNRSPLLPRSSTALDTHAVSGLPLSSTMPNCSAFSVPAGNWPTMIPSVSSLCTSKAVGRSSANASI